MRVDRRFPNPGCDRAATGRWILAAVLVLTTALVPRVDLKAAERMPPQWRSETEGLPFSSIVGHWVDNGRDVKLTFGGTHAGKRSTFMGSWRTPFTSPDEEPSFDASVQIQTYNHGRQPVVLTVSFRYRRAEGAWKDWKRERMLVKQGAISSRFHETGLLSTGGNASLQFEWRLSGVIRGTTALRGDAEISVN